MTRLFSVILLLCLPSFAQAQFIVPVVPVQPAVYYQPPVTVTYPGYAYTPVYRYDVKGPLGIFTWRRYYVTPMAAATPPVATQNQ